MFEVSLARLRQRTSIMSLDSKPIGNSTLYSIALFYRLNGRLQCVDIYSVIADI
jgi:hypothetical protein